jgi:hypothetical protein
VFASVGQLALSAYTRTLSTLRWPHCRKAKEIVSISILISKIRLGWWAVEEVQRINSSNIDRLGLVF